MSTLTSRRRYGAFFVLVLGIGVFGFSSKAAAASAPSSYNAISDRFARPAPRAPQLGPAGSMVVDPTFGTRLIRVTDGNIGTYYPNAGIVTPSGGFQNGWNADSTRFWISDTSGEIFVIAFDPLSFSTTVMKDPASPNRNLIVKLANPTWSFSNPDYIYGMGGASGHVVTRYSLSSNTYAAIVDFDGLLDTSTLAAPYYSGLLSVDATDTYFSAAFGGFQESYPYDVVYNVSTHEAAILDLMNSRFKGFHSTTYVPLPNLYGYGLHQAILDRTGRFVDLTRGSPIGPTGTVAVDSIWDSIAGTVTDVSQMQIGHFALGYGQHVNDCGSMAIAQEGAGWCIRDLTTPGNPRQLNTDPSAPSRYNNVGHPSWNNAQKDVLVPFIEESQTGGPTITGVLYPFRAWDDELIAVATDGSGTVWRFAHLHSIYKTFYDTPRANVSQNGRFAVFTSNWDLGLGYDSFGNSRQDVFLVELDKKFAGVAAPSDQISPSKPLFVGPSPANYSVISGAVALNASANDNVGVAETNYFLDFRPISNLSADSRYLLDTTSFSNGQHVLQAIAVDGAMNANVSDLLVITINNQARVVSAPLLSPGGGLYASSQAVTISTSTPSAVIKYTTDGSTPSEAMGTVYTGPVSVGVSETVRAMAFLSGWTASSVMSASYTITLVPPHPSAVSVSPSAASGTTQAFQFVFSDAVSASNLGVMAIDFGSSSANVNNSCFVVYDNVRGTVQLEYDNVTGSSLKPISSNSTLSNSQCSISASSATVSGASITLTLSVGFSLNFAGLRNIYMFAQDTNSVNTGWVQNGTYTVAASTAPSTVSPNAATGSAQTFQFVFSDTQSTANLTAAAIDFGASNSNLSNSCFILYDALRGTVQLQYDNLTGSNFKAISSTAVLSNSQCIVGATSATVSGQTITLTINVGFRPTFNGSQNIYMLSADSGGANTGWVQKGTFTVATGGIPTADSVSPASGSGLSQQFVVQVSDVGGSSYVTAIAVLIGPTTSSLNACFILFDRVANTLSVPYDNPALGSTALHVGATGSASNSQCRLNSATSSVVFGATSVKLTLDVTFSASFSGARNVYVYGAEATSNTGWVPKGVFTIVGGTPTAVSQTPATGSGSSLADYTFTVSDSTGGANISNIAFLFTNGTATNLENACSVVVNLPTGTVGLLADNGTTLNTKGLGTSANLLNSQCAVGFTAVIVSGNSVQFTVQLLFYPSKFSGLKTVFLEANEPSTTSGWVSVGTWRVQ